MAATIELSTDYLSEQIKLVWLDLETGGLNGVLENGLLGMQHYPILEVAVIVTDAELNEVGKPLRIVINHDAKCIDLMSSWAKEVHTKSGLLDEVALSNITTEKAEQMIIAHLKSLGIDAYDRKKKKGGVMAGNSIMFDRSYIMCQMPELNDYLHYRQLDVSAINLTCQMFAPDLDKQVYEMKQYKHEALADIRESIEELRIYQRHLFPAQPMESINNE